VDQRGSGGGVCAVIARQLMQMQNAELLARRSRQPNPKSETRNASTPLSTGPKQIRITKSEKKQKIVTKNTICSDNNAEETQSAHSKFKSFLCDLSRTSATSAFCICLYLFRNSLTPRTLMSVSAGRISRGHPVSTIRTSRASHRIERQKLDKHVLRSIALSISSAARR